MSSESLPRLVAEYDADGGLGSFAAEVRADGTSAGWFALRVPAGGSREDVEIGWRLRQDHRGHGYATEGGRALLEAGFGWLGLHRVFAGTMTVDTASRRVMDRIGLRYEAAATTGRPGGIEGSEPGDVRYALDRAGWAAAGGVVLRTPRLVLRRLTGADLDALVELDADPEVTRFINGGRPTPRERLAADVLPSWLDGYGEHGLGVYAAEEAGRFVGWFALSREHELGWRLRRDVWGRGLATEGARALLETAFTLLGADRVWAQTMTVNHRSRRVMDKLGLSHVRTFFADWGETIEGGEAGDVEYALTRRQWEFDPAGPAGSGSSTLQPVPPAQGRTGPARPLR